jgi:hypothetical protein
LEQKVAAETEKGFDFCLIFKIFDERSSKGNQIFLKLLKTLAPFNLIIQLS